MTLDTQGNSMALGFGVVQTYDQSDPDSGNRLEISQTLNGSVVPLAATNALLEFFTPTLGQWAHIVIGMAPYQSLSTGQAVWYIYVNGAVRAWSTTLLAGATMTPFQGANYPQPFPIVTALLGSTASGRSRG